MKCVHCGAEIPAGSAFCPKCGAALIQGGGFNNGPQGAQWPGQHGPGTVPLGNGRMAQTPQQSKGVPTWIYVALAMIIAGGIAAAVVLWLVPGKPAQTPTPIPATEEVVEVDEAYDNGLTDYTDMVCYRYLSQEDLYGVPASELRLMRNTIYARKGYIFKSADLTAHFSQFPWYTPMRSNIPQSEFTDVENYNIQMIKRFE